MLLREVLVPLKPKRLSSSRKADIGVLQILDVGLQNKACTWISSRMVQPVMLFSIAQAIKQIVAAVETEIHRKTLAGGTDRSAIAPKNSGDMIAAIADAAKAMGLKKPNPAVSSTLPKGTNQDAIAIP